MGKSFLDRTFSTMVQPALIVYANIDLDLKQKQKLFVKKSPTMITTTTKPHLQSPHKKHKIH